MSGDIAKRIFAKFLKERKLMGIALVYFFGKPSYNNLKIYSSNIKVLNTWAKEADEEIKLDYIAKRLIDMVGFTREPYTMLKKQKTTYMKPTNYGLVISNYIWYHLTYKMEATHLINRHILGHSLYRIYYHYHHKYSRLSYSKKYHQS